MQILEEILDKIQKKELSVAKIAKESDIEAMKIYGWVAKRGKPKGEDFVKLQNWYEKHNTISATQSPINKTESQNLEALIESNKMLSKANMDLAANIVALTSMLNSSVSEERILKSASNRSAFLELLSPVVKGNLGLEFATDEAALLELDRRLTEIEKKKKVKSS